MDAFPSQQYKHVSQDIRALVTPPRRGPQNQTLSPSPSEQSRRRSSRKTSPIAASPLAGKRRCVSMGSAPAIENSYPSPEPDQTSTIEKQLPTTSANRKSPIIINLISDDESSESESPTARPILPGSQTAPAAIFLHKPENQNTTPTRPRPSHNSKSDPLSLRPSTPSPSKIDKRIQACLRKPLPRVQCNHEGVGNNYIFEVVTTECSGNKLMKIGVTRGSEQMRLSNIARECRHWTIEEQDDPEHVPIRLYVRAEQLMHKELEDFKHSFQCRCKVKSHREYFNIDKGTALEVVQRWREFCRREPYDSDGKLRPFWEHRLRNLDASGDLGKEINHTERARRWRSFMKPRDDEIIRHDLSALAMKLWKCRWLAISLVQSFILALLAHPRMWPWVVFAFMVVWVSVETSDMESPILLNALNWAASNRIKPICFGDDVASTNTAVTKDHDEEQLDEVESHDGEQEGLNIKEEFEDEVSFVISDVENEDIEMKSDSSNEDI